MVEVNGTPPDNYPQSYDYSRAVDVTLEAIPAEGYTFKYWKGCVDSTLNPLTVRVSESKSITAYFSSSDRIYGTVQGRIWNDQDQDGIQETSSAIKNISGINVELHRADGTMVSTTLSDNGYYRFTDVEYGSYYVYFDVPSPYIFTRNDQGTEIGDSDADATGKSETFIIGRNSENISVDAGIYETDSKHFEISAPDAESITDAMSDLIVVDVREPDEFCEGHIENALNMPWDSGYFIENYQKLPPGADIFLVCRSGHRSRHASEFLSSNGYNSVYNLATGMVTWKLGVLSCYEGNPILFFQHVTAENGFDTEIGIVNTSENVVSGTFRGYDQQGEFISESDPVQLAKNARRALSVKDFLTNAASIRYIVFESDDSSAEDVVGYMKYFFPDGSSSAAPAGKNISTGDIYIPHIASDKTWATGIALLNPEPEEKELVIEFDDGRSKIVNLPAFGQKSFTVRSLFDNRFQPDLQSALIKSSSGILALEAFWRKGAHSTILLSDISANVLTYPVIANNDQWWTGIVAQNTTGLPCKLTIKPFTAQGAALAEQTVNLGRYGRYVGTRSSLQLPRETDHLQIQSTQKITGFMLIGKGERLSGSEFIGLGRERGILPRYEKKGRTSVVLVNHENEPADVVLKAYTDDGAMVGSKNLSLQAHQQKIIDASEFFASDIREAGYFSFNATRNIGALQFNRSEDELLFDLIPAL